MREAFALVLRTKGITINALSDGNGTLQRRLQRQLKEGAAITEETIHLFLEKFPDINPDWLLRGNGDMLISDSNATFIGHTSVSLPDNVIPVRFFDVNPTATFQELSDGFSNNVDTIEVVPMRGEKLDSSYAVFEIHGDSMEPTIHSHARILCKEIPESRWADAEGVVVISYRDKVVVKRIQPNSVYTNNSITLVSDNPDPKYGGEVVQLSDIHAIFKAKRKISEDIY